MTTFRSRIKELRTVSADELRANPQNFRTHPEHQRAALRGVLEEIGIAGALLAYEDAEWGLTLIDGHLRQDEGGDWPVIVLDVDRMEANLLLSTHDPIAALAGTDPAKLDALLRDTLTGEAAVQTLLDDLATKAGLYQELTTAPGQGGDEFDTTPPSGPTRSQLGDLWQIGPHRLLVGDCTDRANVARLMQNDKAEMIWTDPPYGVAIGDKNKFLNAIARSNRVEENLENDTLDEDGLLAMLRGCFALAAAHCLAGGAWYVAAPPGPLHVLFGLALKELGIWHQTIQWVKNNATFAPLGVDYHWRAEPIFYGWLPGAAHRYYGGRQQDTVWEIDRPLASPDHPTMKPIELVQRAIENSSRPNELVYDPFLGSGTTQIAAHRAGRRCYGCEIAPRYADVILRRAEAEGLTVELTERLDVPPDETN